MNEEEKLAWAAHDAPHPYRQRIALDRDAPLVAMTLSATDPDYAIRFRAAYNTSMPVDLLDLLSTDSYWRTRKHVALNPSTPLEIVLVLMDDKSKHVCMAAEEGLKVRPKSDLVEFLKHTYPEASTEMPQEWLLSLLTIPM